MEHLRRLFVHVPELNKLAAQLVIGDYPYNTYDAEEDDSYNSDWYDDIFHCFNV